ncbi:hypothetical protein F7725_021022 [Dissostichus mawsoni]|uniref:non-specific serine/threonine protein kinase n=1 Tax=Dissostichus mawsoni TaxID=36200 RepID=A0A7J5YEW0_DISMA|nr:hypothetical protein F7725_021022 [Dissostichus mawsoni]
MDLLVCATAGSWSSVCGAVAQGVEWPSMLWERFEGLMMELASDTDEQRTLLPAEVTVNTRCLAMGLENDKVTERKKEAERFRRLLRSPDVVQELDRASGSKAKGSKQLTWDTVFSKSNVTATTLTTRKKKMAEVCSLIKYFIRYANKRGPCLKCSEILKHVMDVLQNSYTCSAYGEDYSSLLVKDILSVRKYWCDIPPQQWHNLLDLYCDLFNSSSKSINRVLVSRVIHTLVQGCCMQTEGFNHALFSFFSKALMNARQEKHLTVLEHLVSALNIFLRCEAMNCRMRVCQLGEELLPSVLYVWADMRPSVALKEEIVEFFNLQICVHHPEGAKTQDTGGALIREISHLGSRGKYVTGTRHIAVKDNLIELTADICHQLFSEDNDAHVLEVTQASLKASHMSSPTQGAASKRRRIELGWEVLRDHLQPQNSDFDVIPWLQITAVLTSKYPSMVPSQELVPLLSVLLQFLSEQRRGERGPYVLRCLREAARCQARHPERAQVHRAELSRLWGRVWLLALRGVSSPQTDAFSLDLLSSIVHGGLINMDREDFPYNLIANILVSLTLKDTRTGLKFLLGAEGVESAFFQEQISSNGKDNLEEIERLYLQFSFNTLPSPLQEFDGSVKTSETDGQFAVVPGLRNKLEQSLLCVADNLLNCFSPDSQATPPECLVRCFSLLTGVLAAYVSSGFLMKMAEEGTMSTLRSVMKLCTQSACRNNKDKICPIWSTLFIMILPASLLSELAEICKLLLSSVSKRVSVVDEDDHMEEDWDVTRTQQGDDIDLFEEGDESHSSNGTHRQQGDGSEGSCGPGAKSLLAEDHLAQQDLALLAVLDFLCECGSMQPVHALLFKPQEVRRRLLLAEQVDFNKALHLNMYLLLLKKLPAEDSLSPEDFDTLLRPLADLCSLHRQDQEICAAVLLGLLPSIMSLGKTQHIPEEMRHVQGSLLQVVSGFCFLSQTGKCVAAVRAALVRCLVALLEADPCCEWAVLSIREVDHPVSVLLPSHLADAHHQVRMLVAMSVESPVCEKQSLFALFQSYKENNIKEQLIKKMLCSVSRALGYRSVKTFVSSHLYYLVAEWLAQRQSDDRYTLGSFPFTLLDHDAVQEFYKSSYQVLIPHLVFLDDFEQVKSIGRYLEKDWKELLADCFPKIMVNILPYFALSGQDAQVAQKREKAHKVYDLLKDASCLGKQQIDTLIHSNLADIVVELLMTLYEGSEEEKGDLKCFIGELDPVPNPPYFSSYVIKATLDYLSKCHSANHKSLVAILSKTPISIQSVLLAVCERAAETTNSYERHRILLMYHLFVSLLLREVKDGLGGAWAFVLRDIIYTLIHYINSRALQCDEVSTRSLSLCCDLLTSVCRAALQFCDDALDCHLQVIVGTLTAQVTSRPAVTQQVLSLLQFLVIESQQKLKGAISRLEPFPDLPEFRELRSEIAHFLSVTSCDSLPLTRLEGLKELTRQLHDNKDQIRELLKECHAEPSDSMLVKLVLSLLQLSGQCLKNILATQSGVDFWAQHKDNRDPMLAYLNPFRKAKKTGAAVSEEESLGARQKLESQDFWIPRAGGHKAWLKALCTALLDKSDAASQGLYDKTSLRTMLAVIDYLRHQQRSLEADSRSCSTVCDSNFWLELNYLEVAKAAQSCSAHFTALLYSEIYVDKIKANMEEGRRINFEENSQSFTISSLTEKSMEDTNISLQELLIEVYRSIGEPDRPAALWSEQHPRHLHEGLESEGLEWGAELRELRFQAAWRNTQWDCELTERSEKSKLGFHESVFCSLQALRDKENLQSIRELESVKQLFSRPFSDVSLRAVCSRWRQSSLLLADSDFSLVEPILAVRSVAQQTLIGRVGDPDSSQYLSSVLTEHLMELCRLARTAGNTQVERERERERVIVIVKNIESDYKIVTVLAGGPADEAARWGGGSWESSPVLSWRLEEAQVFWAKGEQGLALGLLRQMIHNLEEKVDLNPAVAPVYTESLRLCGNWLAETCLENPGVILEKYLERAVEVIEEQSGVQDSRLLSQRTEAFLSLARFSDAQYQSIDKYMTSSEFENKQALLEKAKEEVDLIKEKKMTSNRYTIKVEREMELDQKALSNLQADKQRFLCKAVENYIQCLEQGQEHDTWFLPLMYQLAARMGTKMAPGCSEDTGFHDVLSESVSGASSPHALHHPRPGERQQRRELRKLCLTKSAPQQPSQFDLIISAIKKKKVKMIRDIERLCDAYITLAYMDVSRHKTETKDIPIPADQPIMQIKDLEEVAIPTMEIKVDPSGCYDNLVTVRSFLPQYRLVGGVNLPKIIDCVGSDGTSRRQLVKGQDDLRQDAVMQQEAQKLAFDEKLQVFSEVCRSFRPVFRYFCMERFLDPAVWTEKRLAYTRSVATSSIVGYIVGLGDRHIQNILVDEQTAELVHIDLDIVDGMGITGVEGVFRRCCEKTMEVMRNSQEALVTIVEVLLYDPLFDWTMNPLKAFYLQHDEQQELNATLSSTMGGEDMDNPRKSRDSQSYNKVAERVLLRLQEKLKGVEEGTVLSVGGQVNLLIQQAMDPKNLSRLFSGWQAWV